MKPRYTKPTPEDFAACEVPTNLPEEVHQHFLEFLTPFSELLDTNIERFYFRSIAEGLAGQTTWDHKPMLNLLAKQVGEQFGDENAVIPT